jgi:hypothetical protein
MDINLAMVSAITALFAVIFGPLISIYITNKQINSTVLSANRQAWINCLRNELAELVTIVRHVPPAYAANSITTPEAISKHGELTEKIELVKLLINPNEPDHQELVRLISSAGVQVKDAINQKQGKAPEMEHTAERIVSQSQIILKREWIRVKQGQ